MIKKIKHNIISQGTASTEDERGIALSLTDRKDRVFLYPPLASLGFPVRQPLFTNFVDIQLRR